ncbi:MAG: lytic transglycosylase F [Acidobacteriota bacterium]|nr:lytic transglycosylase F [Acidobacteriota bacterium]
MFRSLPLLFIAFLFPTFAQDESKYGREMLDRGHPLRFQGDLDEIRKNRILRVLVTHTKTNFFITSDAPRGFEYEMMKQYEKFLNRGLSRRKMHTTVLFIPVTAQELIPKLLDGYGDVAAAMISITPERKEKVTFTRPYISGVREIVVGNNSHRGFKSLEDLSGRQVYVKQGSAYAEHLRDLNRTFAERNLPPVEIKELEGLETEDILEMVNAGIPQLTVVDDHLARFWEDAMENLVLFTDLAVHEGGEIAWALPPGKPKLLENLNQFLAKNKKGSLTGNVLFNRYYKNTRWVTNPFARVEREKIQAYILLFRKYGKKYGFDWLAVAALSYQESMFDHSKVSPAGAMGLMQIKPETAADKSIGIPDIRKVENNIHAGVRYMDWIRRNFFNDPEITPAARVDFTLAAYNAGPNRIKRLRRKAAEMGYDPNQWFHHVERAALRTIGQETVRYVVNINKYYYMFQKSGLDLERRRALKKELEEQH